ncbi:MAG: ankyrin repeat domain-containing protein [Planctomycetes bacterium]|nr:ankyrin repeat domain-containing protein [Planctomycetota bacterium]
MTTKDDEPWRAQFDSLWRELVPRSGEADTVQGELIRSLGRLADEALRNGNGNWDRRFVRMCNFAANTLDDPVVFSADEIRVIQTAIDAVLAHEQVKRGPHDALAQFAVRWCERRRELVPRRASDAAVDQPLPLLAKARIETFDALLRNPFERVPPRGSDVRLAGARKLDDVRSLLDAGAHPDSMGGSGWTALHWAARDGNDPVVELLLTRGADPNAPTTQGFTPLHLAAEECRPEAVRRLLAAGADPNRRDQNGAGALLRARAFNRRDRRRDVWRVLRALCVAGGEPSAKNAYGIAATTHAIGIDAAILVTFDRSATAESHGPESGLPWLVLDGDVDGLRARLDAGASVDSTSRGGVTALHMAAGLADEASVLLLLEHGADPNLADADGQTPLHYACDQMHAGVVRALIERGADAARTTPHGCQAIHRASFTSSPASEDEIAIAKLLLAAGADPTAKWGRDAPIDKAGAKIRNLFKKHVAARSAEPPTTDRGRLGD